MKVIDLFDYAARPDRHMDPIAEIPDSWASVYGRIKIIRGLRWAIVSYPATERTFGDWRRNFKAWPKEGRHRGWLREAQLTLDNVRRWLDLAEADRLMLVGFSQGGAVAEIVADLLIACCWGAPSLMAFGAPRPGVARRGTQPRWVRWVARGDLVTKVPPFFQSRASTREIGPWRPVIISHWPSWYRRHLPDEDVVEML